MAANKGPKITITYKITIPSDEGSESHSFSKKFSTGEDKEELRKRFAKQYNKGQILFKKNGMDLTMTMANLKQYIEELD